MLICNSCKHLIIKNRIEDVILMPRHVYNENKILFVMILIN